jgi:hypothetical protein
MRDDGEKPKEEHTMTHTNLVVYDPPGPNLPYLAVLFFNGELIAAKAAPTKAEADSMLAKLSGEYASELSRRAQEVDRKS